MPPLPSWSTTPPDGATAPVASSSTRSTRCSSNPWPGSGRCWRNSSKPMIRPVLRMGDPRLLEKSAPVTEFDTPALHALIQDMEDTMRARSGAGIAAPQIGVQLQVVIFGAGFSPRYPDAEQVPYTVLLNPVIEAIGPEMEEGWEGCLSVPGMRGLVPRHARIRYRG